MKTIMKYWAVIGGLIGLFIVMRICWMWDSQTRIENLLWIHVALLMFHQFEEYVYPGGFKDFYNTQIFQKTRITSAQLSDEGILLANIVVGWTAYIMAAILNISAPAFAVGLLLITIGNGILHTALAIARRKYNPGFITALFAFIPFGIYVIYLMSEYMVDGDWIGAIAILFFGSALIPLGIYITSSLKLIHED